MTKEPKLTKNRYVFDTELTGFINVYEDSGKYNNRVLSATLPPGVREQAEKDREELLAWVKTKVDKPDRIGLNPPKWDDEGVFKYAYGGDTKHAEPIFVDSDGDPVDKSILRDIRKGTKVRLITQQTPYSKPNLGTTLKVLGVQVVELVTGTGAVDSGDLSVEDVAALFGKTKGFKQAEPAVRKQEGKEDYDF